MGQPESSPSCCLRLSSLALRQPALAFVVEVAGPPASHPGTPLPHVALCSCCSSCLRNFASFGGSGVKLSMSSPDTASSDEKLTWGGGGVKLSMSSADTASSDEKLTWDGGGVKLSMSSADTASSDASDEAPPPPPYEKSTWGGSGGGQPCSIVLYVGSCAMRCGHGISFQCCCSGAGERCCCCCCCCCGCGCCGCGSGCGGCEPRPSEADVGLSAVLGDGICAASALV